MANGMIPSSDALALQWMQALSAGIAGNLAGYFVTLDDSDEIAAAVTDYGNALATATNPATRTRGNIALKKAARETATVICRRFGMEIKFNNLISDAMKLNIGIKPTDQPRNPVPAPSTAPIIAVIGATNGTHTLKYVGVEGDEISRKPEGVTNIQIYRAIATAPVPDESEATFYSAFRRNPIGVAFDQADDGKVATYFARWADAKGQVGPWSAPASMRIAA